MSKSVVIIGKWPSVKCSTKKFVDSFDEVAICNFPPMEGYEQYIGNRATYLFINAGDIFAYKKEMLNRLGLKKIFNTQSSYFEEGEKLLRDIQGGNKLVEKELEEEALQLASGDVEKAAQIKQTLLTNLANPNWRKMYQKKIEPPENILPNHQVEYIWSYGLDIREKYEKEYGIWPSTGVMAFDYFLNHEQYNQISLIGFDFFQQGKDVYYFPKEQANPSLHYLWDNGTYSTKGKVLAQKSHGNSRAREVVLHLIKHSKKNITFKI